MSLRKAHTHHTHTHTRTHIYTHTNTYTGAYKVAALSILGDHSSVGILYFLSLVAMPTLKRKYHDQAYMKGIIVPFTFFNSTQIEALQ